MDVQVRLYDPSLSDRTELQRVCADAAFLGKPLEPIFKDSLWFGDLAVSPYLLLEPTHTWVAESEGTAVGYLTASTDRTFRYLRAQLTASSLMFELIPRYVMGKYDDHPRSKRFAEFLILEALAQVPKYPPNAAHFHFNVDKPFRSRGVGTELISHFEHMLREKGIRKYYAEVMCLDEVRPETYYLQLGYRIYDKVRTTVFSEEVDDLYVLCVEKSLS